MGDEGRACRPQLRPQPPPTAALPLPPKNITQIFNYLTRVMYNRRGKMDPLWNSLVVGGVEADGTSFLGTVGMIGVHYEDR
jgi:20S proteasome alpha/beta subunit